VSGGPGGADGLGLLYFKKHIFHFSFLISDFSLAELRIVTSRPVRLKKTIFRKGDSGESCALVLSMKTEK
jgi:hypothetical protein